MIIFFLAYFNWEKLIALTLITPKSIHYWTEEREVLKIIWEKLYKLFDVRCYLVSPFRKNLNLKNEILTDNHY